MKNFIIAFFLLGFASIDVYAQSATAEPASFTGDDLVTITIDVTGTGLANYTGDVYVWTWVTNDVGVYKGPDAPTNSNPAGPAQAAAKMTRSTTNPNIYTISFVPKVFYNTSSVNIEGIGILAKGADWGNGQTSDFKIDVQPPVFDSPVIRIFPTAFSAADVVSIFYDTKLEENVDLIELGTYYLDVTIEGVDAQGQELNNEFYTMPIGESTRLINAGNGVFRITFVPNKYFPLATGDVITAIRYRVRSLDGTLTNPPAGFDLLSTMVRQKSN